jgi:hypothetical protein
MKAKNHLVLGGAVLAAATTLFVLSLTSSLRQPSTPFRPMVEASMGDKEDREARLKYEWMMLRDPVTGTIPKDIRRKELEFARSLPTKEQTQGLNKGGSVENAAWVSRGPWNVGGRTRALGIDITNANIILAGGVSGGMWRSNDGGASWSKRTSLSSHHSVTCIAQDTRSGQTSTWYYGTGELIGNSASGREAFYVGNGIFKSTDNGLTWTQLASTASGDPQGFDNVWDIVWNIAVHPTTGHVYAAVYNGIMRSTNGGTSWSLVLGAGPNSPYSEMTDVAITPNGTIYASGSEGNPSSSTMEGVWQSTDGINWTNITPAGLTSYRRIVIGPTSTNNIYILAETPGIGTSNHSIWKRSGGTWEDRSANVPATGGLTGNFDSQNSYDLVIKVKPDDENVVIIGGVNLYRSTNGFASTAATTWVGGYTSANNSYESYPNHHPDQHSLAFAPGNSSTLYSGHDGGISKTTDILAGTVTWTFLNNGYLTTQCYTVALDRATSGSSIILSGFQDNGCWGVTSASSTASWGDLTGGDGAFTAVAPGGTSYYTSAQNGTTYRLIPSTGNGARIDPQGGSGYLFINPFVLNPNNSAMMFFGGGNYVWRNSDVTAIPLGNPNPTSINWTRLNNSAQGGIAQVSALAVTTSNPQNRLYIGYSTGVVKRVDNAHTGDPAGTTITPPGLTSDHYVSCVAVDPTDGNKVLVVISNYNAQSLFYSADAGQTWSVVEGNLAGPSGPSCRYAAIVPSGGTTTVYLATSTGVYSTTSLNGSSTVWVQEGATTIGNVVATFVDARVSDGTVIVGTHANGVYSTGGGGGGGGTTTVYSGDANNDGICDIRDILPIGRFFGQTGPARPGGSTTWGAQTATVWSVPDATYADCDGNGTVDENDVQGIITNYGRTRSSPDRPPIDEVKLCYDLLREIDRQPEMTEGFLKIRGAIVAYMRRELGVTFAYALEQNYPNPFNPSTTIRFVVPEQTERAVLEIYSVTGQRVWTTTMSNVPVGRHDIVWNGTSSDGTKLASGMYIYRLNAGGYSAAKRMLMIK